MEATNRTTSAPECNAIVANVSAFIDRQQEFSPIWDWLFLLKRVVRPVVCVFGIVGNLLNLAVLKSRRANNIKPQCIERSTKLGLCALAVSDLMCCLAHLTASLVRGRRSYSPSDSLHLVTLCIWTYHEGVVNVFETCSIWLTVCLAVGRYWGICRPLTARVVASVRTMRLAIAVTFIASIALNLPMFWHYQIVTASCTSVLNFTRSSNSTTTTSNVTSPTLLLLLSSTSLECECYRYRLQNGELFKNKTFLFWYGVCSGFVVFIVPFVVLTACNVLLIRALRKSRQFQAQYSVTSTGDASDETGSTSSITVTLIAIIVMFSVLVPPSFVFHFISRVYRRMPYTALEVTNLLALINTAFNFVLYCVVNVEFRKTLVGLFTCACLQCISGHMRTSFDPFRDDASTRLRAPSRARSSWSKSVTMSSKSTSVTTSRHRMSLTIGHADETKVRLPAIIEPHQVVADIELVENEIENVI